MVSAETPLKIVCALRFVRVMICDCVGDIITSPRVIHSVLY